MSVAATETPIQERVWPLDEIEIKPWSGDPKAEGWLPPSGDHWRNCFTVLQLAFGVCCQDKAKLVRFFSDPEFNSDDGPAASLLENLEQEIGNLENTLEMLRCAEARLLAVGAAVLAIPMSWDEEQGQ